MFTSTVLALPQKYTVSNGVRLRDQNLQRIDCPSISKGTKINIVGRSKLVGHSEWWLKVEVSSCSTNGYIRESLVTDFPQVIILGDPGPDSQKNPEIVQEIQYLAGHGPRPSKQILTRARGLFRFPILMNTQHVGSCGSFHYNPDSADLIDAYINKKVGCNLLSIVQEWRQKDCKSSQLGCRIAWGDISHRTKKRWSGHKTHTHGQCLDLRPLRKGAFKNAPMWYQNSEYDGVATEKFIRLLKAHGASTLIFNDPKIIAKGLAKRARGHDNHIHVCFKNVSKSDTACDAFAFDELACENLAKGLML